MYKQYSQYISYTTLYNYYFEKNYKTILSLLNCYFFYNIKKNKLYYRNTNNSKIKKFLNRQKKLYNFNLFYRLFLKKKRIKYFFYYFNKNLYYFNNSTFQNKNNFLNSSYIKDVSLLYNDSILN